MPVRNLIVHYFEIFVICVKIAILRILNRHACKIANNIDYSGTRNVVNKFERFTIIEEVL